MVGSVVNETDLLTFGFIMDPKAELKSPRSDLLLSMLPKGEKAMAKLILGEGKENIRLIFSPIHPFLQKILLRAFLVFHLSIMACGDTVSPQLQGFLQKGPEFQFLVTENTRIGGSSFRIFITEILNDLVLEFFSQLKDMERDPQLKGHTSGIFDSSKAATSYWARSSAVFRSNAHRGSDHFITLFLEKPGGGA
jgi:hypothetical protein